MDINISYLYRRDKYFFVKILLAVLFPENILLHKLSDLYYTMHYSSYLSCDTVEQMSSFRDFEMPFKH